MISQRTGYLLIIGGSVLFACTGVISKAAIDGGIAPLELAAFRSYGAGLLLLPFLLVMIPTLVLALVAGAVVGQPLAGAAGAAVGVVGAAVGLWVAVRRANRA